MSAPPTASAHQQQIGVYVRIKGQAEGQPSILNPAVGLAYFRDSNSGGSGSIGGGAAITLCTDPTFVASRLEACGIAYTREGGGAAGAMPAHAHLAAAPAPAPTRAAFKEYAHLGAVFGGGATGNSQADVYAGVAAPMLQAIAEGRNCAIVCYGQTGSGAWKGATVSRARRRFHALLQASCTALSCLVCPFRSLPRVNTPPSIHQFTRRAQARRIR